MPESGSPVYGIDLGTTYSVVAKIDETGRPAVVRNHESQETTPSVVHLESASNVVVGAQAKELAMLEPDHVVSLVKRQMGTDAVFSFHGESHSPESLSALILKHLATGSETHGIPITQVVITVPAYFGMRERDATRKAGEIAGLTVLGIVPEPVAAALHYELSQNAAGRTVLVYDLGGGTFDTTVIRVGDNGVDVLVTDGDKYLGGADWDARLAAHILDRFIAETQVGNDVRDAEDVRQEIALKAEEIKKALSQAESRPVNLKLAGAAARFEISRADFEAMTSDLLDTTITIVRRTLAALEEKSPGATLDEILLVGGSTKMPAVAARLEREFGWTPRLFEPDFAVAKGAAIWALSQLLVREEEQVWESSTSPADAEAGTREVRARIAAETGLSDATLAKLATKRTRNVLSKAFGVKLLDSASGGQRSYVQHLAFANDALPTGDRPLEASTVEDGQTAVQIELYEQAGTVASEELTDNIAISGGAGVIDGIPPRPAGAPIDIVLRVDDEGLLAVSATHRESRKSLDIAVTIGALSPEEVDEAARVVGGITVSG